MARSGEGRPRHDDPHHADEDDADVCRQGQTEGVRQAKSLERMSTEDPLRELAHAAGEAGVKALGGDAEARSDRRERGAEADRVPERGPRHGESE